MEDKLAQVERSASLRLKAEKRLSENKVNNKLQLKQLEEAHNKKVEARKRAFGKELIAYGGSRKKAEGARRGLEEDERETLAAAARAKAANKKLKEAEEVLKRVREDLEETQRLLDKAKAANRNLEGEKGLLENELEGKKEETDKLTGENSSLAEKLAEVKME